MYSNLVQVSFTQEFLAFKVLLNPKRVFDDSDIAKKVS